MTEPFETIETETPVVACDGGNGPLGHPVEYMTLEKGGEVTCQYCGRRYVHISKAEVDAIRRQGQRYAA